MANVAISTSSVQKKRRNQCRTPCFSVISMNSRIHRPAFAEIAHTAQQHNKLVKKGRDRGRSKLLCCVMVYVATSGHLVTNVARFGSGMHPSSHLKCLVYITIKQQFFCTAYM